MLRVESHVFPAQYCFVVRSKTYTTMYRNIVLCSCKCGKTVPTVKSCLYIFKFTVLLATFVVTDVDAAPPGCPCATILIYMPVCGTDGRTYSNSAIVTCEAKCTPGKQSKNFFHSVGFVSWINFRKNKLVVD